ncbi:SapC family protein, partial [Vibrio parahaemolyticus]
MRPAGITRIACRSCWAKSPPAATTCPLFFVKDPENGQFNLVALFGFRPGELLIDGADKGQAPFVPLEIVRQGFYTVGD